MNRQTQLFDLVRNKKPKHVIEIGTWTGKRALEFMAVSNCYYTGFDLFEDATPEINKAELNAKRPSSIASVGKAIEQAGFNKFCLIRGNTHETLPDYFSSMYGSWEPFDFAYIDGGHSIATMENDYRWITQNIEEGGTIILNGWYDPQPEGFGCNFIDGEVLPSTDKKWGKYDIHLLKVDK